jgi:NTP pyrophosphatase (non-canonical NTP hydrolase)
MSNDENDSSRKIGQQRELFKKLDNTSISVNQMQDYFEEILKIRGFGEQSAKDKLLLLMEEVGELAKALRKQEADLGIDRSKISSYESVESEIADVAIVLISLCNVLHVNFLEAIIEKEKMNMKRTWN